MIVLFSFFLLFLIAKSFIFRYLRIRYGINNFVLLENDSPLSEIEA